LIIRCPAPRKPNYGLENLGAELLPRRIIRTDSAPKPGGPYSQGIVAGDFLFVAGQDGRDPVTGKRPSGVRAQTRQTLSNLKAVLKEARTNLQNVVKVSVFLNDIGDFDAMNLEYSKFFPKEQPVRTTIQTTFRGDMLVEIDAIALIPKY
jgi:2-iminobutanoate/2-iminopropanoate deaminase